MHKKISLRQAIFWILLFLFAIYVYRNTDQIEDLYRVVKQGEWAWLILALIAQAGFFYFVVLLTRHVFKIVNLKRKVWELFPLIFSSIFVNTLAPTAGQSGTILFADDAAKRDESSPKAVIASVITTTISYVALSFILAFAVIYLWRVKLLNNYEIIGAIIFIGPTVIPGFLILLAHRNRAKAERVLHFFFRLTERVKKIFKKHAPRNEDWSKEASKELFEASESLFANKKELLVGAGFALIARGFDVLALFLIFLAFDLHIHYGALIAGYAFAEVAQVISPQPEGIGAVELVMVLLFVSFGVAPVQAAAIALIFRGLNFWIPLTLGFFLIKRLRSFQS